MTSHRDVFESFSLDSPQRVILFNLLEKNLLIKLTIIGFALFIISVRVFFLFYWETVIYNIYLSI